MIIMKHTPVYWECTIDGHSKFWAAQIIEDRTLSTLTYTLVRKWGMIGTKGQQMEQSYNSKYEAEQALSKLIFDKQSKGYRPIF